MRLGKYKNRKIKYITDIDALVFWYSPVYYDATYLVNSIPLKPPTIKCVPNKSDFEIERMCLTTLNQVWLSLGIK